MMVFTPGFHSQWSLNHTYREAPDRRSPPTPATTTASPARPRLERALRSMRALRDKMVASGVDPGPPLEIHIAGLIKEGLAARIRAKLRAQPLAEVRLTFDSLGGRAIEAEELYSALRRRATPISAHVARDAHCSSAAAQIYLAAERRTAEPGAHFLLHFCTLDVADAAGSSRWTAELHLEAGEVMRDADRKLIRTVAERTGNSERQIEAHLRADRPMNSWEARSLGLVHEIIWKPPPLAWRQSRAAHGSSFRVTTPGRRIYG